MLNPYSDLCFLLQDAAEELKTAKRIANVWNASTYYHFTLLREHRVS